MARNDQVTDKSRDLYFEAIALYPGETPAEGWYVLNLDTMRVVKRSNFVVCTKYSERTIRVITEKAQDDYRGYIGVPRHEKDNDRVVDGT